MATKPDQTAIDEAEFTAAFNEDQTGPREQTEEEAFSGMAESGTSDASTDGDVVTVEGDGQPEGATDGEPAAEAAPEAGEGATTDTAEGEPAAEPAAEAPADPAMADAGEDEPTDPKELQRKKSWEGRLRAREEELRLREEALAGKGAEPAKEEGAESAPAAAMDGVGEKIEAAAEMVESGEMTPEQALKTLEEDFGPEFVKMMSVIIGAQASKAVDTRVGEVSKTIDQLIGEIVDDKAREHFGAIADAHPDFNEINGSEKFAAYMASMSDADRAKAEKISSDGSARQIIKLLDGYKAWASSQGGDNAPAEATAAAKTGDDGGMGMAMGDIDESAADAAEGVRSTGMSLPNNPERDDSYESAWAKF